MTDTTVLVIVRDYLKQNGFDGLHSHPFDDKYGGCGCAIDDILICQECIGNCRPAYKHTLKECTRCPDFIKCEAFENDEQFMYCGKKKV